MAGSSRFFGRANSLRSASEGRAKPVLVPEESPRAVAEVIDACLAANPALKPAAKEAICSNGLPLQVKAHA